MQVSSVNCLNQLDKYIYAFYACMQYICTVSVNEHAFGNLVFQVEPLVSKLSKC